MSSPVGAILFVRYDSSRLYGKALKDISGQPLLDHVLGRVRRIDEDLSVVLATTKRQVDTPLIDWAEDRRVAVYCGAFENVAERAVACAREFGFSGFVRVCGDRPFLDPEMNRRLITMFLETDLDLATNAQGITYPSGATAEVVRVSAMETVLETTDDPEDMEHLTRYIYRHPGQFCIANITASDPTLSKLNLAVDTAADLARTRWVAGHFDDPVAASFEAVVSATRQWQAK
jgi:spore coat polysaccharide biosynthesis protein SpsF